MNKRIRIYPNLIVIILFTVSCNKNPGYKAEAENFPHLSIEKRVNDLLSRMTIEEKAAQLDMLSANDILSDSETLSPDKVRYFIDSMNIGAIHDLYPQTAALANELQRRSIENSRLGIPLLFIEEALHGYQGKGATVFPIPLGMASTWDTALVYNMGRVIATEARAHGIHFVLGPNLDLAREIRWGRVEETYGEDVYLTSRIAVNLIKGLQGNRLSDGDAVVAEPKHFALHGSPENGSNEGPVSMSEREARSTGLYVFEKAVKEAQAQGIMAAYHEIDGIPSVASRWLLTTVLRNEWNFNGMVVTDLGAIKKQITTHKTAANEEEAVTNAISAGLDMQFYDFPHEDFQRTIVEAVKNGKLAQKDLDRAAGDVLRIKFLLGLFDNPYTDETLAGKVFHTDGNRALALRAARESVVLLKNENNVLPLDGKNPLLFPQKQKSQDKKAAMPANKPLKRITLTGNLAAATYVGGYSPAGARAISVHEALKQNYGDKIKIDYINAAVSDRFSIILPAFLSPETGKENGLNAAFFNNPHLQGEPVYSAVDANLNPYWHNLSPAPGIDPENFSARWSGYITVPATGIYEFDFRADDYGRIFINNRLFLDHWNPEWQNRGERKQIRLEGGKKIPVSLEYAKLEGNAGVWLKWRLTNAETSSLYADITRSARNSDAVIVVMGEAQEEVGESRDKSDLNPHGMDMDILKAAVRSDKPVVTVMITGRPLILTEVNRLSSALLQCWFPGEAAGTAITDVLFGTFNPSGRLAVTFPESQGETPMYYSHKPSAHRRYITGEAKPLFPFGYGLSYTDFEYANLKITPENPSVSGNIAVSVDVTNTGARDGEDVVQLYVNDMISSVTTPVKQLKGFSRVYVKAGDTQTVTMTLTPEHFSLVNEDMKRVVEPGEFNIMIGSSASDIKLNQIINIK